MSENKIDIKKLLNLEEHTSDIKEDGNPNPEYAKICFDIAQYYLYNSEYPKSDLWYKKSLKVYDYLNFEKEIAENHFGLGRSYCMQDKYEESLKSLSVAQKYYEMKQEIHVLCQICNTVGLVCKDMERYKDSISNYEKALKLVDKEKSIDT